MTNDDLNDISEDQINDFPEGVSEVIYDTEQELNAFITGLTFADDTDVYHGKSFKRQGKFVVRVCVGDWE